MSHRGLRNISSQIDPEVRPWKNSSNAILLAGIYLCLKNIVPNRSKFRPCLGNSFNASIPAGCCPSINVMYECQKLALSALNLAPPKMFQLMSPKDSTHCLLLFTIQNKLGLKFYFKKSLHDLYSGYTEYHILLFKLTYFVIKTHTT